VKELRTLLAEFNANCLENNIKPIILYIPHAGHIYARYITGESGTNWREIRDSQVEARANVEKAVAAVADELGVAFISLTVPFESAAKNGAMLYHPFDSHWNSVGKELAAAWVARQLEENDRSLKVKLRL
jgi:hypothetical protein